MAYNGTYFVQDNFSGGYCGNYPASDLALNQAADLDNIVIGAGGKSFRTTWPTIRLNATEFGSADTYPVIGVGVLRLAAGNEYALVIKNTKAYSADVFPNNRDSMTFTDRTGSVTIGAGGTADVERLSYRWFFTTFNDKLIGFGGLYGAPNVPFKWIGGANNISALTGSPPSATFCFSTNNRVFAGNTAANPQTVYWSILGNEADWTGTGSGSAIVGSLTDGEPLIGAAVLSNQVALLFKPNSIHQMNLASAPFPNYPLFTGIGAANPGAIVTANGLAYFIDINGRMHSTDGNTIKDYSDAAQNLLIGSSGAYSIPTRYFVHNVFGYRHSTAEYDWLVWSWIGSGGTSTFTTIWDLRNECWLRCSTGFGFTSGAKATNGFVGGGWNLGRLFSPDTTAYTINDTDGITTVTSFWRTGWLSPKSLDKITQISRFGLSLNTENDAGGALTNSWTIKYGFNFLPDTGSFSLSAAKDSTELQTFRFGFPKGRGVSTQYKIGWISNGSTSATVAARINSILFAGKSGGQGRVSAHT